jgi:hypothetical protein
MRHWLAAVVVSAIAWSLSSEGSTVRVRLELAITDHLIVQIELLLPHERPPDTAREPHLNH